MGHGRLRSVLILLLITAAGARGAPPAVVVASAVERPVIEPLPLTGTVSAPRVARLSPGVAGLVAYVTVDEGDRVEAATPLLTLDAALARWSLDAARAATEQAREEHADAQRRLQEVKQLVDNRAIARTEMHARQSEARLDAAVVQLREAEERIAAESLARHRLEAPFAGVISRKLTEAGEWVDPGDPVLELVADRELRIDFAVPQRVFPRVSLQTPVEVNIEALAGRPLPARIGTIVPVSDPQARTFIIRVYPRDENLPLTPGMSASALLRLDTGQRGVVVSRDALLRHPDGRVTAWVVDDSEEPPRVRERQLETGLGFDGRVVVRRGLKPGEQVVVEGNEALVPGQQVRIREVRP